MLDRAEAFALGKLDVGAQVDHRAKAAVAQHGDVAFGQAVQAIGAVDAVPAGDATIDHRIAAEVTEVVHP
ncbi:MAG TPA: hypothetical protein PLV68_05060, partial [Ilumatobacteraceae bacterium]|nr:hypothetical protein [Ilumatobacteraceae bacterium]